VSPSPLISSTRTFKWEYISLALSLGSISNGLSFLSQGDSVSHAHSCFPHGVHKCLAIVHGRLCGFAHG
jgi:hypothetical protein